MSRAVKTIWVTREANDALVLRWADPGVELPLPVYVVYLDGVLHEVAAVTSSVLPAVREGYALRVDVLACSELDAATVDHGEELWAPARGSRLMISLPEVDLDANPDFACTVIYWSEDGSEPSEELARLYGANNTSYITDVLEDGVTYKFRARLMDQHGNLSDWGATVAGTVNGAPASPENAAASYDQATRRATITASLPASQAADVAGYALFWNCMGEAGLQEGIVDQVVAWVDLRERVQLSGTLAPAIGGVYAREGEYNGEPYFRRGSYYIFYYGPYGNRFEWQISVSLGSLGAFSWYADLVNEADGPAGVYTPTYGATGEATVAAIVPELSWLTPELGPGRWVFEWRAVDKSGLASAGARCELNLGAVDGELVELAAVPAAPVIQDAVSGAGTIKATVRLTAAAAGQVIRMYVDGVLSAVTVDVEDDVLEYPWESAALAEGDYSLTSTVATKEDLEITGAASPDVAGIAKLSGEFNEQPYWKITKGGQDWFFWFEGQNSSNHFYYWILSSALGDRTSSPYWFSAQLELLPDSWGGHVPQNGATGYPEINHHVVESAASAAVAVTVDATAPSGDLGLTVVMIE